MGSRVPGPGSRTARDGNGFRDHEEETSEEDEDLVYETPLKQRYDFNEVADLMLQGRPGFLMVQLKSF